MEARVMETELKRVVEGPVAYTPHKSANTRMEGEERTSSALTSSIADNTKSTKKNEKVTSEPLTTADKEALETYLGDAKKHLAKSGVELKFKFHESGDLQVELVNADNDKVVRKIPPDELLELSASLREMAGTFLNRSI